MSLLGVLEREITVDGPISVARFMDLCLGHPTFGYYTTRDPLGSDGDFTTAPEISQMFGEMVGVWAATCWQAIASPDTKLVELGPGRGTMAADVLRVLRSVGANPEVWLVETSPALRTRQAQAVPNAHWADTLSDVPSGPSIILANEFLDALPVHQFIATPAGWRERLVGWQGKLVWGLSEPLPGGARSDVSWREHSPAADAILAELAARLSADRTAALIIDYGYGRDDRPPGPTLQALRAHAATDPLAEPGDADLTWLLDFDGLAANLLGARWTTQAQFLARMGIGARAQALAQANPADAATIADALERLTAPAQMGTLFKVLGVVSPELPAPPGFEEMA